MVKVKSELIDRVQVLGSLITHIGSGLSTEIGAALDTLWLITKRKAQELLPMSSFLNGEMFALWME